MRPNKLLFGATGFSIATAAFFMGAGAAAADTVCTEPCTPPPPYFGGLTNAISKVDLVAWKMDGTTAGDKLQFAEITIIKVLDKTSP